MSTNHGVVIVGASAAGFNVAETLRREGYTGSITLLGEESHLPYDRPSVSKRLLLGQAEPADVALCTNDALTALAIDYRAGTIATGIDAAQHHLRFIDADGREGALAYDSLVVATGARPRRWEGPGEEHVRTLRTLDDSSELRRSLRTATRVLVIGAGILGYEIVSAAQAAGCSTTLVGRSPVLGFGGVGRGIAGSLVELLVENDVDLRLGVQVEEIVDAARGYLVRLTDGSSVQCDLVVAAIGAEPSVEWLHGSGLDLKDGVACDAHGHAGDDIYAVGDVAGWLDTRTGTARRVEHQMNAIEQGQAIGRYLASGAVEQTPLPFFWSEIFGSRITAQGHFTSAEALEVVAGSPTEGRFVAVSRRGEALEGVLGWNMPREFRIVRAELLDLCRTEAAESS